MAIKKYLSLERLEEYDGLIKAKIDSGDASTLSSAKSYTDTEVAKKANTSHTHDDRYYTETEIDSKISTINTSITNITSGTTVVKNAEHAETADSATTAGSATKATQDGNGKVISSTYETKSDASAKLTEAKAYADTAASTVKNDLLNGAGTAYDTLKELGDLIVDNADAIEALETIASGKANATHSHAISDVSGLQSALDGKAASSHGTHVTFDSTNKPKMDGTAAFGTSTSVARADHVHPTDTSRASQTALDTLETVVAGKANASHSHAISDITNLQTTLDGKASSSHSHTITASASDDDVVVLTGTNGSNKVTYSASHADSGVTAGTYKSVTVNSKGHVTAGTNPTTLSGYGITDAYTKTQIDSALSGKATSSHSHDVATTSANGFMSSTMVSKLSGIAEGANKTVVDSALSGTSTNPVQNKIINSAISTLNSSVSANTSSISSHTTAITNLQTAVGEFEEITSEEISQLFA